MFGRRLVTITNFIIQEALVNYFKKYFNCEITPFKTF